MKLILGFLMVVSVPSFAADCTLDQARSILEKDLLEKVSDNTYDGRADFCVHGSLEEQERKLEAALRAVELNDNPQGGDYILTLCEASQSNTYDIVVTGIYCSGAVEHTRYTQD